jgi:hypothetical protein
MTDEPTQRVMSKELCVTNLLQSLDAMDQVINAENIIGFVASSVFSRERTRFENTLEELLEKLRKLSDDHAIASTQWSMERSSLKARINELAKENEDMKQKLARTSELLKMERYHSRENVVQECFDFSNVSSTLLYVPKQFQMVPQSYKIECSLPLRRWKPGRMYMVLCADSRQIKGGLGAVLVNAERREDLIWSRWSVTFFVSSHDLGTKQFYFELLADSKLGPMMGLRSSCFEIVNPPVATIMEEPGSGTQTRVVSRKRKKLEEKLMEPPKIDDVSPSKGAQLIFDDDLEGTSAFLLK